MNLDTTAFHDFVMRILTAMFGIFACVVPASLAIGDSIKLPGGLAEEWLRKEFEAADLEEDVREKWRQDPEFKNNLSNFIVKYCDIAFFDDQKEDTGGLSSWGAGILIVLMPREMVIDTLIRHMDDEDALKDLAGKRNNSDELFRHLERQPNRNFKPCFTVYRDYIWTHGLSESKPLVAYMMERDLIQAATTILNAIEQRENADQPSKDAAKKIRAVVLTVQALAWELEVDKEDIGATKRRLGALATNDAWWIQLFAKKVREQHELLREDQQSR